MPIPHKILASVSIDLAGDIKTMLEQKIKNLNEALHVGVTPPVHKKRYWMSIFPHDSNATEKYSNISMFNDFVGRKLIFSQYSFCALVKLGCLV